MGDPTGKNIDNTGKMYGYAGKILRLDLTHQKTEVIPSSKYLPEYIGGRALCNKIFWDEVKEEVGAFDPKNKLIFATGATTATGIPTGGRCIMGGVGAATFPEQYTYGSCGGFFGSLLKLAGYDALIIEGKAPEHTYVFIEDDKVEFLNADYLWGKIVTDTQEAIREKHGEDVHSIVIGPAGENLCRNAMVVTCLDLSFSKSGFGAVFGSKNLKAITVRGNGSITPGDIPKIMELRKKMCGAEHIPNPVKKEPGLASTVAKVAAPGGSYDCGRVACSPGCTSRCERVIMDQPSPFYDEHVNQVEKCVSVYLFHMKKDIPFRHTLFMASKYNNRSIGMSKSFPVPPDKNDPDYDLIYSAVADTVNYYEPNWERGAMLGQLCSEYGLDKWEIGIFAMAWLAMCRAEGLLDELDFGMEPDVNNIDFVKKFVDDLVYRRGLGDVFAEGMARAIRKLGKAKFGDTIYHGRFSDDGEQKDIPVSLETSWGGCGHWQGRGLNGTPKWVWIMNNLLCMLNTRDALSGGHPQQTPDEMREYFKEDPQVFRSRSMVERVLLTEKLSIIKDSVTSCEWQAPDLFWPTMETELYNAATGLDLTPEELLARADRARLLFRAILMRSYHRDRDLEVENVYPMMTYPDLHGETATWDDWNDTVDLYYSIVGWDRAHGWPYRETWEAAGLGDVADELEALGKVPAREDTSYVRKPNPIGR